MRRELLRQLAQRCGLVQCAGLSLEELDRSGTAALAVLSRVWRLLSAARRLMGDKMTVVLPGGMYHDDATLENALRLFCSGNMQELLRLQDWLKLEQPGQFRNTLNCYCEGYTWIY